ncbi:MAG: UDP-N-acetylmuramoyl-L-alanyl-D-glutamate--2,6-diaminopimelate ligase [Chloroflexota bacterium]|nr:UDP-N-acetylmuramoyl-L-alanyl-D-glutamate--2,6-diaminopimelate ligase [Chloroflexota bacterium]MDQ5864947.1 UDP-N-acetylmuramoyl-L-alanyl-D-glutamate--2,6-diaminopimelate ligase [Chloroflexota bacterium]
MKLQQLITGAAIEGAHILGSAQNDIEITHICENSRLAEPGSLFVAVRGSVHDGHRFIPDSLKRGAVAVAGEREERPEDLPANVPYVRVLDDRLAVAQLSAALFDYPSRKLKVVGVTGTDGKTTTSTLIHAILKAAGRKADVITTIRAEIGGQDYDTGFHVTTPEAFDVQRYLHLMVEAGTEIAVLETTSHALDQGRVACVDYDVAVVTNVTHEHLDWHGSWENYMASKARLFEALNNSYRKPGTPKVAVINADDQSYTWLKKIHSDLQCVYGMDRHAQPDISVDDIEYTQGGTRFVALTPVSDIPVRMRLPGKHNIYNAMAAIGAALALGADKEAVQKGLASVEQIRGRMEWVREAEPFGFDMVVDFAHTPNALEVTLELARQIVRPRDGRVIVVFGSAGLRDREKRGLMGRVAGRLADVTVITAEDPRTERVEEISAEIANAMREEGRVEGVDFFQVYDRAEAIDFAVQLARRGDIVLTCGKAHESSMCYGTEETPWDEFAAVRAALARKTV